MSWPVNPRGWSFGGSDSGDAQYTARPGLSGDDYARLLHLRDRIAKGLVREGTPEATRADRRLIFVRLCILRGKFSDYE